MPRMNGITFLKKIMAQHPIPVVIISSSGGKNIEATSKALEYGAVEVLSKDMFNSTNVHEEIRIKLCDINVV